jgi:hypothetical protein
MRLCASLEKPTVSNTSQVAQPKANQSSEEGKPQVPEGGGLVRHRHETVARRVLVRCEARLEQQSAEEERHAPGERRNEIGEHDLLQNRRPLEGEKGTD